jgi:hypothetical protein
VPTFAILINLGDQNITKSTCSFVLSSSLIRRIEELPKEFRAKLQHDEMNVEVLVKDFQANVRLSSRSMKHNWFFGIGLNLLLLSRRRRSHVFIVTGGIFGLGEV